MRVAPQLHELTHAQSWGDLLVERESSTSDPIRFVTDVRKDFVQRASASHLVSRGQLLDSARRAARSLSESGVGPGDSVLLQLPAPQDFLVHFFACQLLGAVAIPVIPPWSLAKMESQLARVIAIAKVARPRATVVSDAALAPFLAFAGKQQLHLLGRLLCPERSGRSEPLLDTHPAQMDDTAMVQFTSGSTSHPRGVVLTHRNLFANCYAIGAELGFEEDHVGCSWLPLFHDMGLIGNALVPLLWSIPTVLMPPESFALRPTSWLQAVSGFKASISTAPNFAFQMVTSRLTDEQVDELDLSSWRVALCGGEPILTETVTGFTERFAARGFNPKAFCPVYGLAESSLAVSLSSPNEEPQVESVDRELFLSRGEAVARSEQDAMTVVSCGRAPAEHEIAIFRGGEPVGDGVEGGIHVRGPSVMRGYLSDPAATAETMQGDWLITGDRGYLRNGELFVTGREKELIVKGGRNFYPQEIEAAAAKVPGVRPGRVAAFGLNAEEGTELLIVVVEVKGSEDPRQVDLAVMEAVSAAVGIRPDRVAVVPPDTLTKTSSGKMQRLDAAHRFIDASLKQAKVNKTDLARLLLARTRLRLGLARRS